MFEIVDANDCHNLTRWLRRLEYLKYRETEVLIIQNYHQLLYRYPLVDEIINDWFPHVIGLSKHLCKGKVDYFFWKQAPAGPQSLCPIFITLPKRHFQRILNHRVGKRIGPFILVLGDRLSLFQGQSCSWKTLFYWIFFAIFDFDYANESSRPAIK